MSIGKKWNKFQVQTKPISMFHQVVTQKNRVGSKLQETLSVEREKVKMEAV